MAGITTSVRMVDDTIPPIIGTAIRSAFSSPSKRVERPIPTWNTASVGIKENDPDRVALVRRLAAMRDARNPVERGVTFFTETVPGLHARVPLRCSASRHEMGTREDINDTFASR